MNTVILISVGGVFLLVGAGFCAVAAFLARPESVAQAPLSKPSSIIFYMIGAVTVVFGLVALVLHKNITRQAAQLGALVYLVVLSVLFGVFYALLRGTDGHEPRA